MEEINPAQANNISDADRAIAVAAAKRIRANASKLKIPFDWEEIKREMNEGRP